MVELQENTSNPLGRKEVEEMRGNGTILMKRPLSIGRIPQEIGNIYQVLKRSQLGINQVLSEEHGTLVGWVEDQVTAPSGETSIFLHYDNTILKTKHEREIENISDQCWTEGLP